MHEYQEFFYLLTELAVVLIGFAGVTAAFAGRDRVYLATERNRMEGLFIQALIVLFGTFSLYCAQVAELDIATSIRCAAIVSLLFLFTAAGPGISRTLKVTKDQDSSSESWSVLLAILLVIVEAALFCYAAIYPTAWPLAIAYSIALLFCVWLFFRLLTRRN